MSKYQSISITDFAELVDISSNSLSKGAITVQTPTLLGRTGFGKTKGSEAVLRSMGYDVFTMVLSEFIDSAEVIPDMVDQSSGLVLDRELRKAITVPPAVNKKAKRNGRRIIIFDEVQTLALYTDKEMNTFRQIITERRAGNSIKVHKNVSFVVLGNLGEDTVEGLDPHQYLPPMVTNNMMMFSIQIPTIRNWIDTGRSWGLKLNTQLEAALVSDIYSEFPDSMCPRNLCQLNAVIDSIKTHAQLDLVMRSVWGNNAIPLVRVISKSLFNTSVTDNYTNLQVLRDATESSLDVDKFIELAIGGNDVDAFIDAIAHFGGNAINKHYFTPSALSQIATQCGMSADTEKLFKSIANNPVANPSSDWVCDWQDSLSS